MKKISLMKKLNVKYVQVLPLPFLAYHRLPFRLDKKKGVVGLGDMQVQEVRRRQLLLALGASKPVA
jgi:hypothetical protein